MKNNYLIKLIIKSFLLNNKRNFFFIFLIFKISQFKTKSIFACFPDNLMKLHFQ